MRQLTFQEGIKYEVLETKLRVFKEGTGIYLTSLEVNNDFDAGKIFVEYFKGWDREGLAVLVLDTKNKVIGINLVSVGTLNSSLAHPREIFKPAIMAGANAIVIGHNHPSQDLTPSREDIYLSKEVKRAGELLAIPMFDSIIVSDTKHISLRDKNLI